MYSYIDKIIISCPFLTFIKYFFMYISLRKYKVVLCTAYMHIIIINTAYMHIIIMCDYIWYVSCLFFIACILQNLTALCCEVLHPKLGIHTIVDV